MCELTTIATIASLSGTAMTAYSAVQQGKQKKAEGEYNARVSENNAKKAENRGVEKENQFRLQTAKLRKEQEAQFGAGNVQLDSGSAADILAETDMYGEVDALNIRANTADEVEGYGVDATNSRIRGRNDQKSSNVSAFSSVLSGASAVSSKWYRNKYKAA